MFFGCCLPLNQYNIVYSNGYESIILPATEIILMEDEQLKNVKELLALGPLKCETLNSFCLPTLKLCGKHYDQKALEDYCIFLAQKAHYLGIRNIGVGAPGSRHIENDFSRKIGQEQFKNSLNILSNIFKKYSINILLEPICSLECNFINTTAEAIMLIDELGLENLYLVYDLFHAQAMDESTLPIYQAKERIKVVHIADNINNKRCYLKTNSIDKHRPYAQALNDIYFDGEVAVEAFEKVNHVNLKDSLNILKKLFL